MAKAQEMLSDPVYMAAAKKKVQQLQAQAQQRGMLDANGMPVPGAATSAAQAMGISVEDMKMAGVAAGVGGAAEARQWEIENAESYRSGEINDAELGMANLQQASRDPAMLKQAMDMFRDPNTMAEVKKMMADPAFAAQAQRMVEKMKANGGLPDFSQLGAAMGNSAGGGAQAELERLRRENAALRAASGFAPHDEL